MDTLGGKGLSKIDSSICWRVLRWLLSLLYFFMNLQKFSKNSLSGISIILYQYHNANLGPFILQTCKCRVQSSSTVIYERIYDTVCFKIFMPPLRRPDTVSYNWRFQLNSPDCQFQLNSPNCQFQLNSPNCQFQLNSPNCQFQLNSPNCQL